MDINTIFERPFDFDKYMEERLLAIEDEGERAFARKYLTGCLSLIMRESEQSYKRLEDRVYAEIPLSGERYHIYYTVVDRAKFDTTNGAWAPLIQGDEKPRGKEAANNGGETPAILDRLFYKGMTNAEAIACSAISGTVHIKSGEYGAVFSLTSSMLYRDEIERLYKLFGANGLPWATQNCGYLFRFYDLAVAESEAPKKEEILDYAISEEGFSLHFERDRIPVWNVRRVLYKSTQFVAPVIDSKHFEHTFPIDEFGKGHGYLVEGNQDILSLRQVGEQIFITTAEESFSGWTAYQIIQSPPKDLHCFDLPIMHNAAKDYFAGRFIMQSGVTLQSKHEIFRQTGQYDLMDAITLEDAELLTDNESYDGTYMSRMNVCEQNSVDGDFLLRDNLNWFIADGLANHSGQRILLLSFRATDIRFYTHDLISFIVSHLQRSFSEYRCEAILKIESGGKAP